MKIMEKAKNWCKTYETELWTTGQFVITAIGLGVAAYVGMKGGINMTENALDAGLYACESRGFLKFFNPTTGQQISPGEFCALTEKLYSK